MPLELPTMQTIGLLVLIIAAVSAVIYIQRKFFPHKARGDKKLIKGSSDEESGGSSSGSGGGEKPSKQMLAQINMLANTINSWQLGAG